MNTRMSSLSGCVVRDCLFFTTIISLLYWITWATHERGVEKEELVYNSRNEKASSYSRRLGTIGLLESMRNHFKRHKDHTTGKRWNFSAKNETDNSEPVPMVSQNSTNVASTASRHIDESLRDMVLFYSFMTVSPDRKYRTIEFYDLPLRNKICYMQHKKYCWLIQTVGNSEIDSSPAKERFIPTWYKPIGIWKILHPRNRLHWLRQ